MAICNGLVALVSIKLALNKYLLSGHMLTRFSNAENSPSALADVVPLGLQDVLNTASGGNYVKASKVTVTWASLKV